MTGDAAFQVIGKGGKLSITILDAGKIIIMSSSTMLYKLLSC